MSEHDDKETMRRDFERKIYDENSFDEPRKEQEACTDDHCRMERLAGNPDPHAAPSAGPTPICDASELPIQGRCYGHMPVDAGRKLERENADLRRQLTAALADAKSWEQQALEREQDDLRKQEPVAWRWRGRADEGVAWCAWDAGSIHPPYQADNNYQIEPLYAAPRQPEAHQDETVIARHSGKTLNREWHSVGEWLYPDDEIVSRSPPEAGQNKKETS